MSSALVEDELRLDSPRTGVCNIKQFIALAVVQYLKRDAEANKMVCHKQGHPEHINFDQKLAKCDKCGYSFCIYCIDHYISWKDGKYSDVNYCYDCWKEERSTLTFNR